MQLAEMISIMSGFGIETKDTSWVNIQQVIELLQKQAARIAELEAALQRRNAVILPPVVRPDFHIEDD